MGFFSFPGLLDCFFTVASLRNKVMKRNGNTDIQKHDLTSEACLLMKPPSKQW